eukprot:scaffold85436_cov33-Prasinocladus_malaysianus.AAC.1
MNKYIHHWHKAFPSYGSLCIHSVTWLMLCAAEAYSLVHQAGKLNMLPGWLTVLTRPPVQLCICRLMPFQRFTFGSMRTLASYNCHALI